LLGQPASSQQQQQQPVAGGAILLANTARGIRASYQTQATD